MSIEAEILAMIARGDAILITNVPDDVAASMADDWVYVDGDGFTTKRELIGWIASGRLAHHSMTVIGEPRVAVHGDTAIVTARKASSGTWDGVPYAVEEWISDVFVRENGRWLCVLSQKTAVP